MNEGEERLLVIVCVAALLFIIIIYCFRKRQHGQRNDNGNSRQVHELEGIENADIAALNKPPPSYNEVINTNLYPPTANRFGSVPVFESQNEEPITPPPNYDTALHILAQSEENLFAPKNHSSSILRRSVSTDLRLSSQNHDTTVNRNHFQRMFSTPRETSHS